MKITLVTVDANGNEIVRMITLNVSPFVNMMHVYLDGVCSAAKDALVTISSSYQLGNGIPALAAIAVTTTLPVWRLITCEAIGGIILSGSILKALHCLGSKMTRRVQLRVVSAILGIASDITELSVCMASFTLVGLAAIRTGHFDFVFTVTGGDLRPQFKSAFSRTEVASFLLSVWQQLFILGSCDSFLTATNVTGNSHVAAGITPFPVTGVLKRLSTIPANFGRGHLTSPVCLAPGAGKRGTQPGVPCFVSGQLVRSSP